MAHAREHPAGAARLGRRAASSIWSALFTVGNFLYGRNGYAGILLAVFLVERGRPDLGHQQDLGVS